MTLKSLIFDGRDSRFDLKPEFGISVQKIFVTFNDDVDIDDDDDVDLSDNERV